MTERRSFGLGAIQQALPESVDAWRDVTALGGVVAVGLGVKGGGAIWDCGQGSSSKRQQTPTPLPASDRDRPKQSQKKKGRQRAPHPMHTHVVAPCR